MFVTVQLTVFHTRWVNLRTISGRIGEVLGCKTSVFISRFVSKFKNVLWGEQHRSETHLRKKVFKNEPKMHTKFMKKSSIILVKSRHSSRACVNQSFFKEKLYPKISTFFFVIFSHFKPVTIQDFKNFAVILKKLKHETKHGLLL